MGERCSPRPRASAARVAAWRRGEAQDTPEDGAPPGGTRSGSRALWWLARRVPGSEGGVGDSGGVTGLARSRLGRGRAAGAG